MPRNRLRLDFSLQTAEERVSFLNSYLPTITFEPDEHELETLSDYLLWGKNQSGLNTQQEGLVSIKEWAPSKVESIDGLLETPGFQEQNLHRLGTTNYKTPRTVFNREEALRRANPFLQSIFEDLFQAIDQCELTINYYELQNGKRKNPPREQLLNRFTPAEQEELQQRAAGLNQRQYLKMRHHLVELRTEQYSYKDCIDTSIISHQEGSHSPSSSDSIRIGEDVPVLPLGLHDNSALARKIFQETPDPSQFTPQDLKAISDKIWQPRASSTPLNFEDPNHLLVLYRSYHDLRADADQDPDQIYTSSAAIFNTLHFYEECARLNDLQREILNMKIQQKPNIEIANYVNQKYGTSYNDNYISTIYRHKILESIAEAATRHKLIIENIFYPENFKKCKDCGKIYLRAPEFFMRQHKAPDGFSPRCKACQKKKREENKHKYEIKYVVATSNK